MRMIDHFIELMAYTALFIKENRTFQSSCEDVVMKYSEMIEKSKDSAKNAGFPAESWEKAFFAICAWIDEAILCSEWLEKEKWQHSQLQKTYFNTTRAGEEFFSFLAELNIEEDDNAIREVYLYCLLMGFKGMYFMPGDRDILSEIKKQQKENLKGNSLKNADMLPDELVLFPHGYEGSQKKKRKKWYRINVGTFIASAAILSAAAFILLIFFYKAMLNNLVAGYIK